MFIYDFRMDKDIVVEAFKRIFNSVPVLHSAYVCGLKSYWEIRPIDIQEAVIFKEVSDEMEWESEQNKFLKTLIPPSSPIQLKAGLFYCGDKTAIVILTTHLVMDGRAFRYVIYGFCDIYSKLVSGEQVRDVEMGDRSCDAIYADMTPEQKKTAKGLITKKSKKDTVSFIPLTPISPDDSPMVLRRRIPEGMLPKLIAAGKKRHATVNDMLLASFFHSLYTIGGFRDDQELTLCNFVDLRRYLTEEHRKSVTNHTSWFQCLVPRKGANVLETLEMTQASVAVAKNNPFMALEGITTLSFLFGTFPRAIAELLMGAFYKNPPTSLSNIGILDSKELSVAGHEPVDGFITGAIKLKPYILVSATTLRDDLTLVCSLFGNDKDRETIEKLFDLFIDNFNALIEEINQ